MSHLIVNWLNTSDAPVWILLGAPVVITLGIIWSLVGALDGIRAVCLEKARLYRAQRLAIRRD